MPNPKSAIRNPKSLPVLPRPKIARIHAGRFVLDREIPVVLSPLADDAERLAAALVADSISDLGGPALAVERHGKLAGLAGPAVQMFLFGRDEKLAPELTRLALRRNISREGYVVDVSPRRLLVGANTTTGLFYAAQTLVKMVETDRDRAPFLPSCRIVDWPDFKYRGVMIDVSRFRVPTQETLTNLVFRLAACKINVLQLYVEHTFHCRRRPGYSVGSSPLTAEQFGELDDLCRMLHIELQANQNSLGHLQHMLNKPGFERYAERSPADPPMFNKAGRKMESPWSLRLDDPAVYELLDDIYAEHLAAVRSPLVNLGCDEVFDLGTGRSRSLVERKGKVRAFVEHIRKIAAIARRYGKTAMIWDDMIRQHPEALPLLPKDVIPVFWHYNNVPGDSYWKVWGGSGRRHWVAPGCSGWQSIFGRINKAWDNIHWITDFGRRGGAEGVLNTEWGDYGHFQPLSAALHGIAVGGELSWNSKPMADGDKADFDARFARAMFNDRGGRMGRLYRTLGMTNHVFSDGRIESWPWRVYWDKFPDGPDVSTVKLAEMDRAATLATEGLARAKTIRRNPPPGVEDSLFEELILAGEQTILAARKARLAARVRTVRKNGKRLPATLRKELRAFLRDWRRQKDEFKRVWLLGSRVGQIAYRLRLYDEKARELARLLRR